MKYYNIVFFCITISIHLIRVLQEGFPVQGEVTLASLLITTKLRKTGWEHIEKRRQRLDKNLSPRFEKKKMFENIIEDYLQVSKIQEILEKSQWENALALNVTKSQESVLKLGIRN